LLAEKGGSNAWIGIPTSLGTVLLLLLLPALGAYSDRTGKRIVLIKISSALMILSQIAMAFMLSKEGAFGTTQLLILSFFYLLYNICVQSSYMFYSSMLRSITNETNNTKVSGIGLGLGQLGNVLALALATPLVGSSLLIWGISGKPLALLFGAICFAVISLPFFSQKDEMGKDEKVEFSYKKFLKKVAGQKRIMYFLIGYSLLADTILTFQLYASIYIKKVFGFTDQMVTYAGMTGLAFGMAGGLMAAKLVSRLKDKERALLLSSLLYTVCFALCALIPRAPVFVFSGLAIAGISYGLVFTLARTVYSEITPLREQGEFFSLFTVFERAASIIGPLVWLLTFHLLGRFGENIQYRGSVLLLGIVCFLGFYFLRKSRRFKNNTNPDTISAY
jgi:UMF1 family MFS transporter